MIYIVQFLFLSFRNLLSFPSLSSLFVFFWSFIVFFRFFFVYFKSKCRLLSRVGALLSFSFLPYFGTVVLVGLTFSMSHTEFVSRRNFIRQKSWVTIALSIKAHCTQTILSIKAHCTQTTLSIKAHCTQY